MIASRGARDQGTRPQRDHDRAVPQSRTVLAAQKWGRYQCGATVIQAR